MNTRESETGRRMEIWGTCQPDSTKEPIAGSIRRERGVRERRGNEWREQTDCHRAKISSSSFSPTNFFDRLSLRRTFSQCSKCFTRTPLVRITLHLHFFLRFNGLHVFILFLFLFPHFQIFIHVASYVKRALLSTYDHVSRCHIFNHNIHKI